MAGDMDIIVLNTAEFEPGSVEDLVPPQVSTSLNYLKLKSFKTAINRSKSAVLEENLGAIDLLT